MGESEETRQQNAVTSLESKLRRSKETSDFLVSLVDKQRQQLYSIKALMAGARENLEADLANQSGVATIGFEIKKLNLIAEGERRVEQALIRDLMGLRQRFSTHDLHIPDIASAEEFVTSIGDVVETSMANALTTETELIKKKTKLTEQLEITRQLSEQLEQLEATNN